MLKMQYLHVPEGTCHQKHDMYSYELIPTWDTASSKKFSAESLQSWFSRGFRTSEGLDGFSGLFLGGGFVLGWCMKQN